MLRRHRGCHLEGPGIASGYLVVNRCSFVTTATRANSHRDEDGSLCALRELCIQGCVGGTALDGDPKELLAGNFPPTCPKGGPFLLWCPLQISPYLLQGLQGLRVDFPDVIGLRGRVEVLSEPHDVDQAVVREVGDGVGQVGEGPEKKAD